MPPRQRSTPRSAAPGPSPGGPRAGRPAVPSRPSLPPEYGAPQDDKGLLPWAHVVERLTAAPVYWICAASPAGRPHATPVDGLWHDGALYFGGSPATRRQRYLRANPAVSVHLESGHDVVILNGEAREQALPRPLAEQVAAASRAKYGYGPSVDDLVKGRVFVFRPREVFAWKQFPKDVTRWQFPG